MEWFEMRNELVVTAERVATLLADAPSDATPVRGLEWTVGDLGAHLVTVARRNVALARGEPLRWPEPAGSREALAALNASELLEFDERDPARLAAMLATESEEALGAYGDDPTRPVRWYHLPIPVRDCAGIWLSELLIHGLDLARTLRRPWPITRDQAGMVSASVLPVIPAFVRPSRARDAAGVYHLHLRGQFDATVVVEPDGSVETRRERPPRADVRISADPVANLLVSYGRASRWWAITTGKIAAWGRRPWLALRFADLFERP